VIWTAESFLPNRREWLQAGLRSLCDGSLPGADAIDRPARVWFVVVAQFFTALPDHIISGSRPSARRASATWPAWKLTCVDMAPKQLPTVAKVAPYSSGAWLFWSRSSSLRLFRCASDAARISSNLAISSSKDGYMLASVDGVEPRPRRPLPTQESDSVSLG